MYTYFPNKDFSTNNQDYEDYENDYEYIYHMHKYEVCFFRSWNIK